MNEKLFLFLILFIPTILFSQVTADINSGDPVFPFPQFLEYQEGTTLALESGQGVTHADMELAIRDAYQVYCNSFRYTGTEVDGVKYILSNRGCPYDCAEGQGYGMLAAAYMGDRTTFNGIWMRVHDDFLTHTFSYQNGDSLAFDYRHGEHTLAEGGDRSTDAAADGDWDIGLALLVAAKQWGTRSGVMVADGSGGTKEMDYIQEAFDVIKAFGDTTRIINGNGDPFEGFISGNVGLDGYVKGGNTFGENTTWAATVNPPFLTVNGTAGEAVRPSLDIFSNDGNQDGFASYTAPAYYRSYADFMEQQGAGDVPIEQFKRAEASSEWIMEQSVDQGRLPFAGAFDVSGTDVIFKDGDPTQGKSEGEAFRMPWRTILNFLWRSDGRFTWDPVTHSYTETPNTALRRNAEVLNDLIADPGICTTLGKSPDALSTTINHSGISQIVANILGDGTSVGSDWINFILGTSSPAVAAVGSRDQLAQLYRQLELKWDDVDPGTNREDFRESEPGYFHGWFRLLGMMTLTGNYHAPENLVPVANMKVYLAVDRTFAFVGDEVNYTIDYRNFGTLDAENVTITVPVDTQYEIVDAGGGSVSGNNITYTIGTVPGFESANRNADGLDPNTAGQFTFKVRVASPKSVDRICQTATIATTNGTGWTNNEFPNNVSYTMERNCVDILGERALNISKTANREAANPGDNIIFNIDFSNSSDAGFLNGGRNHVNFSYGLAKAGDFSVFHTFRAWNNAEEAFIQLDNYRASYYIFDPANIGIFDEFGDGTGDCLEGPNGWRLIGKNLQTGEVGDAAGFQFCAQAIPEGQDEDGKFNQRIIIQFPPEITAPTHAIFSHLGNRFQLHQGTLNPIWYEVQQESVPSTNLFQGRTGDDWSFNEDFPNASSGQGSNPYNLIGPNYADVTQPGILMDRFDRDACTGFFGPEEIHTNILIEEFDGFVWRRIGGEGPLPGREMTGVVICDTIPAEYEFVRFIDDEADGVTATLEIGPNGEEIVKWVRDVLLVGTEGDFQYEVTVKGSCPGTSTTIVDNLAWILSDTDSPVSDTSTVRVTCEFVPPPVAETTFTKEADRSSAEVGDEVTYTLEFEQTIGAVSIPPLDDASRWTQIDPDIGSSQPGFPEFRSDAIDFGNGAGAFIYENFTHGTNGELIIAIDHDGQEHFGLIFRYTGGTRPANNVQGVYVDFQLAIEGSKANITVYDNGIEVGDINGEPYAAPFDQAVIRAQLNDGELNLWLNNIEGLPFATFAVSNTNPGFVGFAVGNVTRNTGANSKPTILGWDGRFDSAFDLFIKDDLPTELSFISASDNPTVNENEVVWDIIPGPVLAGTELNYTVTAEITSCPAAGSFQNVAFVNAFGIGIDSLGAQAVVACDGVVPECVQPVNALLSSDPISGIVCSPEEVDLLAGSLAPAPTSGFEFEFFRGTTSIQGPSTTNTITVSDAGAYTVVITDPADPATCRSESSEVTVVVDDAPDAPVTSPIEYCLEEAAAELTATAADSDHTLIWYSTATSDDGTTTAPVPSTDTEGVTSFFVSQENANGCESERAEIEVTINELPTGDLDGGGGICPKDDAENLTITLSGAKPWVVVYNDPMLGNITIDPNPTENTVSIPVINQGEYSLVSVTDSNNCEAVTLTGIADVTINDTVIATAEPICNEETTFGGVVLANDEFQIVITVTKGDLESIVIEPSINGIEFEREAGTNQWYSTTPIDELNIVDVNVTDEFDCGEGIDIEGINTSCSCPATASSSIGTEQSITVCEEDRDTIITVTIADGSTDYNVIVDRPNLADTTLLNVTGPTVDIPVNEEGVYGIRVASNGDGGCTVDGGSVTITYHIVPTAELSGNDLIICDDDIEVTNLSIELTDGALPYNIDLLGGTSDINLVGLADEEHLEPVMDAGTYTLNNLVDGNGCEGTVSGMALVEYRDSVVATFSTICNSTGTPLGGETLEEDEFQIVITVTDGDLESIVITPSITDIDFEREGVTNQWYSTPVNELSTVDVNVTDQFNCGGGLDIEGINTSCSCPATASSDINGDLSATICEEEVTDITVSLADGATDYNIIIDRPSLPDTTLFNEAGPSVDIPFNEEGIYAIRVVSNGDFGGCTVDGGSVTITHHGVPSAELSGATTICDDGLETTDLVIGFADGSTPYSVDIIGGTLPINLTGLTEMTHEETVGEAANYTLASLIDGNGCEGTVTGSALIEVDELPSTPVLLTGESNPIETCLEEETLIVDESTAVGTGIWTKVSGTANIRFGEETIGTATVENLDSNATGVFRWIVSNGACIDKDSIDVTIDRLNATTEATISLTDNDLFSELYDDLGAEENLCDATAYEITGSSIDSDDEVATWEIVSGTSISITEDGDNNQMLTFTESGTTVLKWRIAKTGALADLCPVDSQLVRLTVFGDVNADIITTEPLSICGSNETLDLETAFDIDNIDTDWRIDDVSINNLFTTLGNSHSISSEDLGAGTHTLVWAVSNDGCGEKTDEYIIDIEEEIIPSVEIDPIAAICQNMGAIITAQARDQNGDLLLGDYAWTVGTDSDPETSETLQLPNQTTPDELEIRVSFTLDPSECIATGLGTVQNSIERILNVQPLPTPVLDTNGVIVICNNEEITIEASSLQDGSNRQWFRDGEALEGETNASLIDRNESGVYTFSETGAEACGEVLAVETVILEVNAVPEVDAKFNEVNPIIVKEGGLANLSGFQDGESFMWTAIDADELPVNGLVLDPLSLTSGISTTLEGGVYFAILTSQNVNCIDSDTVIINVRSTVQVPNVFTPNEDGENDYFEMPGIETFGDVDLKIYGRGGRLVHSYIGPYFGQEWDGTFEGTEVPEGAYYYILDLRDGEGELTGVINIVR